MGCLLERQALEKVSVGHRLHGPIGPRLLQSRPGSFRCRGRAGKVLPAAVLRKGGRCRVGRRRAGWPRVHGRRWRPLWGGARGAGEREERGGDDEREGDEEPSPRSGSPPNGENCRSAHAVARSETCLHGRSARSRLRRERLNGCFPTKSSVYVAWGSGSSRFCRRRSRPPAGGCQEADYSKLLAAS